MVASHKLNVFPTAKPVRQRVRRFHQDRHQIIQTEVDNLLATSFTREVKYPEWLANKVVLPKKGGKWCVCVDYTNLNEACLKDSFLLARIDQIVDGIEANTIQLKAIMDSQTPTSRKGVQKLTGWLAALRLFISRFCHPKGSPAGRLESRMRSGSYNNCHTPNPCLGG